jgi:V/A-type H+-transporting ATPase subunit E
MNEVSNDKIDNLRSMILTRAGDEKNQQDIAAQSEVEKWVSQETEKLQREVDQILQDARQRAEDMRRRQIFTADKDKSAEMLRLQNRLLDNALERLQDKLVALRERSDYAEVLTGMCIEASETMSDYKKFKVRFASLDSAAAAKAVAKANSLKPDVQFVFDPEPLSILGGCQVVTDDNSKQINLDWQSVTQDSADDLANRLIPLL